MSSVSEERAAYPLQAPLALLWASWEIKSGWKSGKLIGVSGSRPSRQVALNHVFRVWYWGECFHWQPGKWNAMHLHHISGWHQIWESGKYARGQGCCQLASQPGRHRLKEPPEPGKDKVLHKGQGNSMWKHKMHMNSTKSHVLCYTCQTMSKILKHYSHKEL